MKLKYVYYVVYLYQKGQFIGTGTTTIYRANKINSESEVQQVEKFLIKEYDVDKATLTNFILLNKRGK